MNFFRPQHEYFVGLIVVQAFFSFNFPLREYFFCISPPPPPISFLMVCPLKLEIFREIFARSEEKTHSSARARDSRTIQILRYSAYCNINTDIRVADSQSDLRILL